MIERTTSTLTNVKSDKSMTDVQEQQAEILSLRQEQILQAQKNNELKILEHQVT